MGILNITPDSFSDGGEHYDAERAIESASRMVADGATLIDVGGESTRPGAVKVSEKEQLDRVLPVVKSLSESGYLVSVDTSEPEVMRACVEAGAFMINDIRALSEGNALAVVAELGVPVCLMHMSGDPSTMQNKPEYQNVLNEVIEFLANRAEMCVDAGIDRNRIIVDPGFGFGKTLDHNLCLLRELRAFEVLQLPVLAGLSRKSMFGALLDAPVDDRLYASVAGAMMALERGAKVLRVHDVRETAHALSVFNAVTRTRNC